MEALLIGRDREVAQLAGALAGTRSGRGSRVIFSGPAGIGKSWLLDQAADFASSAGVPVLRGSAISDAGKLTAHHGRVDAAPLDRRMAAVRSGSFSVGATRTV